MDFYARNLQTIIDNKHIVFGREPEDPMDCIEYFICCEIFKELLESVQYLHDSCPPVIHRDLKPQNVMIDQNNNNNRFIKLCDFGLATDHMKTSIGHTCNVGTHAYMAPELHQRRYNNKVDIYSLGVIAMNLFVLFDCCGDYHSLVVTGDDCVYGWGYNRYGQTGCGEQRSTEVIISPMKIQFIDNGIEYKIRGIYCGVYSSFAVTTDGRVFSWGQNNSHLGHNISDNTWFEDNKFYVGMELCSHSLVKILSLKGTAFGRQSAEEAMNSSEFFISCQIFAELLKCVQHLHDLSPAVIHRNLKPENVLIGGKAENLCLKLCDFGLSHVFKSLTSKRDPEYLSPEETDGQTVDYKTDVYSAAKIGENIFDMQLTNKLLAPVTTATAKSPRLRLNLLHIGSGGFGDVYKVKHKLDQEIYAIKVIKLLDIYDDNKRQDKLNEVQKLAKLRSEYVVNYRNSWLEDNHLFIQMDFYTQNLQTILNTKHIVFGREPKDPMDCIEYFICCEIFRELLESVQYLHDSCPPVIHRDLKPANVLISVNNINNRFIKLCDFGLATDHMNTSIGHTSNLGTHAYMAPEIHQRRYNNKRYPGAPIQVLKVSAEGRVKLDLEALSAILLRDSIRDKPVVVVSIAGDFHSGKSIMRDFFLRYLQSGCGTTPDWLGSTDTSPKGFSWRSGSERVTTGILMWSEPFCVKLDDGQEVAIVLMDTQRALYSEYTVKDSATLFALSTMTSSIQVFNVTDNLQENDIEMLDVFAEYGRLAVEANGETPFQKLMFLIQDWIIPYENPYDQKGDLSLLMKRLHQPAEMGRIMRLIQSCFSDIGCYVMPYPGGKVATTEHFDGRTADIDSEFVNSLKTFVPLMLDPKNVVVKEIGGRRVTGRQLMEYFKVYINVFD
ncbi:unnamed protein product, partial [Medioppia subpectinata]